MKKSIILAAAALLPLTALADGFVSIGGASNGCHYATEATVGAYTAGESASVHHGILAPTATQGASGISAVAASTELALRYDAAGRSAIVLGASPKASVAVVSTDGRTLAATFAEGGIILLSNLEKGIYIVRVADGDASATLKIAL